MYQLTKENGPVVVTGCSGFTGGHMVKELSENGYDVRACIRDASSWRGKDATSYLETLRNVEIINGCDLFVKGSFDSAFQGAQCVFHMAAVLGNSADGKSQPLGAGDIATDVYEGGLSGTQNVIDAINASESVKRLIYTSSMAAVSGPKAANLPSGYEWTEEDWASDDVDDENWNKPQNAYAKSKVDTERLINEAAGASGGKWDAITMNPAMICGPILFKAQVGQWIEQIGRVGAGQEPNWPSKYDMYYNIIDVRDLVEAHRLAAESSIEHSKTLGGSRYIMHGSGGLSAIRLGTDIVDIIRKAFPENSVGKPETVTSKGDTIKLESRLHNDSKKAKSLLKARLRPVEETIKDVVQSSFDLGVITPVKKE